MATKKTLSRQNAVATEFKLLDESTRDDGSTASATVQVTLRAVDGPTPGKEFTWFGSLHENAIQYTFEALRAMGWRCSDITKLEGLGSTQVQLLEKEDEWQGKKKIQVQIWAIKAPKPEVAPDKRASFASRFKKLAAEVKPLEVCDRNKAPESLPEVAAKVDGPVGVGADEDIPF